VPVTLELAQTVAIGAFNPYVITPGWLVKYGICARDEEVNVRMVPLGDGASFVFGLVEWQVDGQKLGVSSANASVDCGAMVAQVLDLVPHTPVRAIGHNFHFTASKVQWADRPSPNLGNRGMENLEGAEQVRWSGIFRKNDARLEVTLAYEADLIAVFFNYHRNMDLERAIAAPTPPQQIAQAREAAGQFREDFDHSRALLGSLFGMEASDG
jgi:hypothetical protein